MIQNKMATQHSVSNYFYRSKDVHEENGERCITLFCRLSREFTYINDCYEFKKTETVWVDIKEILEKDASENLLALPNRMIKFEISDELLVELFSVSKNCPEELYSLTPFQSINKYTN